MCMKKKLLLVLCVFLFAVPAFAQASAAGEADPVEEAVAAPPPKDGDFWICPGFEAALYGRSGLAYGGSLALAYGKGASIGLKAAYFFSPDNTTLELNFLLRFYLRGAVSYSGPFLQFAGGTVLFADEANVGFPATIGSISAGLAFGWRFLIKDRWFVEPSIRGGYPFLGGGGIAAGVRF